MDPRKRDVGGPRRPGHRNAVAKPLGADTGVALSSIGVDEAAGFDDVGMKP